MVANDVVLLTHRGTFQHVDGVAGGSPVGPLLAIIFVSQFDAEFGSFSNFYFRYIDDVIRTLWVGGRQYLLDFVSSMHPNLKVTIEEPDKTNVLAFLDMNFSRLADGTLSSEWYRKNTDTGILPNFYALGSKIYKRAVLSGFTHRIFSTTSSWLSFKKSLKNAQVVLRNYQYPKWFVENVTNYTLSELLGNTNVTANNNKEKQKNRGVQLMMSVEYRGNVSEDFMLKLKNLLSGSSLYYCTAKLRSQVCQLKAPIPHVYII